MTENALEIKDLTKQYPSFLLDHISFSIPKGCIMGLIGENGAGKTTTIKAMLNLIARDEGTVNILGTSIDGDDRALKEQIGVVFDDSHFHGNLTPLEIGAVLRRIYKGWDQDWYLHTLKAFSLPPNKKVSEISKGMSRKLSIAAAMAHRPRLLILDEATAGLDPVVREEILDIFQEFIQDEEHAILLSSHITSDLDKIADYVTFLHEGKVLLSREKDRLLESMGVLRCSREDLTKVPREYVVKVRDHQFGWEALVQNRRELGLLRPSLIIDPASLEDIMLFYIRGRNL